MIKLKRTKLSRKLDRAKVSMQKHEITYSRKLAKRFLENKDKWRYDPCYSRKVKLHNFDSKLSYKQVERICKHFLKCTVKKQTKK